MFECGLSLTCECSKCGEKIVFNKEDVKLMKTIYSKGEIKEVYGVRCSNCKNYTYVNEE